MAAHTYPQPLAHLMATTPTDQHKTLLAAYCIGLNTPLQQQFITPELIREEIEYIDDLTDAQYEYVKNLDNATLNAAIISNNDNYSDEFWDNLSDENSRMVRDIVCTLIDNNIQADESTPSKLR